MLELKIICYCGQKYKFDVEPVNGQMPFTVKCPICNLEGTARANEMLTHLLALPPKPPVTAQAVPPPGMIVPTGFAPPPAGYTPPPAPASPPPAPSRTVSSTPPPSAPKPAPVQAASSPAAKPASAPTPMRQSAPVTAAAAQKSMSPPAKAKDPGQFNLVLGIVGGLVGALLGCGLMYAIWYRTRTPYLPVGVVAGVLTGYGARWLARGTATTLGIATAIIAGGAVTGTLFYMGGIVPLSAVSIAFGAGVAFLMSSSLMVTPAQKRA